MTADNDSTSQAEPGTNPKIGPNGVGSSDLAQAADRPARTYSGGMRRRLDIASSLLTRPRVLFLDEPTTGLDPRSRNEILSGLGIVPDGIDGALMLPGTMPGT